MTVAFWVIWGVIAAGVIVTVVMLVRSNPSRSNIWDQRKR